MGKNFKLQETYIDVRHHSNTKNTHLSEIDFLDRVLVEKYGDDMVNILQSLPDCFSRFYLYVSYLESDNNITVETNNISLTFKNSNVRVKFFYESGYDTYKQINFKQSEILSVIDSVIKESDRLRVARKNYLKEVEDFDLFYEQYCPSRRFNPADSKDKK